MAERLTNFGRLLHSSSETQSIICATTLNIVRRVVDHVKEKLDLGRNHSAVVVNPEYLHPTLLGNCSPQLSTDRDSDINNGGVRTIRTISKTQYFLTLIESTVHGAVVKRLAASRATF